MNPDTAASSPPSEPDAAIAALAATWAARRNRGLDDEQLRELRAWVASSPTHARAFAKADGADTVLDWPLQSGRLDDVLGELTLRATKRRRRRAIVTASCMTAAALLFAWFEPL